MLTEGVLSRGGTSCVLTAVSQHALIPTAASTVVKQSCLPHCRRELTTQHTAVRGIMRSQLEMKQKHRKKYMFYFVKFKFQISQSPKASTCCH